MLVGLVPGCSFAVLGDLVGLQELDGGSNASPRCSVTS